MDIKMAKYMEEALYLLMLMNVVLAMQERSPCIGKKFCGECISFDAECAWCTKKDFKANRCDTLENLKENGCPGGNITHPDHQTELLKNEHVMDGDGETHEPIQLQPQRIKVKLRPNKVYTLNVDYRVADNHPADLYVLMDLSNTMQDDKENLAKLGHILAENLQNITKDYRLGFGSFMDKVVLPFTMTTKIKLEDPCGTKTEDGKQVCESPYAFQHRMSLERNAEKFVTKIREASITGNLDPPEGGLEALMQVLVCENDIGWRKQARRILLLCTDGSFHHAGDGKLAGIVRPNDGRCHLDTVGRYTADKYHDYPSIGQIAKTIRDRKVNVIFAVDEDQVVKYTEMSSLIDNAVTKKLDKDGANIVDLIKESYDGIRSKVLMKHSKLDNTTSVKFRSRCLSSSERPSRETDSCVDLKIGDTVSFQVEIRVNKCPPGSENRKKNITIYPAGLQETTEVEVELMCDCDCQSTAQAITNSPACSKGNGTFECGVCRCNEGRSGEKCECDLADSSTEELFEKCKRDNSSQVCMGRGKCECGVCRCVDSRFQGKFCEEECDNESCDFLTTPEGNLLCGGETRGRCLCGNCVCNDGYDGSDCGCGMTNTSCITQNGLLCNGHGQCTCGKCVCENPYRQPTCETCPTCPGVCERNEVCAACVGFNEGAYSFVECQVKCGHVEVVEVLEDEFSNVTLCYVNIGDCTIKFTHVREEKDVVKVLKFKECVEPVNVLPIVLGITGGILFVGIVLLLIWKILTSVYDKMEYSRWEQEINESKFATGVNPIYRQPVQTYENPAFSEEK